MLSEDTRIVACTRQIAPVTDHPYPSNITRARTRTSSLGQHWPPHGGARTIPWRIRERIDRLWPNIRRHSPHRAAVGSLVWLGVCAHARLSASATAVGDGRRRRPARLEVEAAVARGLGPVRDEPPRTVARRKEELVVVLDRVKRRRERACTARLSTHPLAPAPPRDPSPFARDRMGKVKSAVGIYAAPTPRQEQARREEAHVVSKTDRPWCGAAQGLGWGTESSRIAWLSVHGGSHQPITRGVPLLHRRARADASASHVPLRPTRNCGLQRADVG